MKNLICALLAWVCFLSTSQAAIVTSLYQANVPVASQSQEDWQNAMPQALSQVLIKVSGDTKVAQIDKIKSQLSQASSLVQSYSYINNPQANAQNNLILQVQFDSQSVNKLLRQAGINLWSKQRPVTLILLAVQTPQGEVLVNNDPSNTFGITLQNNANQRGIPILLPVMDLEDMQNSSLANILQLDSLGAMKAAKRYGANETLIGRVYPSNNGQWHGQILLVVNDKSTPWDIQGSDINQVLANIIDNTANTLVANVDNNNDNFVPAQKQTLLLHITNVNGLSDYAAVVKYLRSLAPVTAVNVININPSDISVNVDILGGVQALNDAIAGAGTQMQAVVTPPPSPPPSPDATSSNPISPDPTVSAQPTTAATQPEDATLNYRWLSAANNVTNNSIAPAPASNTTP